MSKLIYVENDGAIFRGPSRAWPSEVWSAKSGAFVPYKGDIPKGIAWGNIITEEEAAKLMAETAAG